MNPSTSSGLFHLDSGPSSGGRPLVLIHGAGGTHRHWPESLRTLAGHRVIALDLPGHGASAGPAPEGVAGYAQVVLGLLDELGLGHAVIAGHSMGGAIALTLALQVPARVAGLVLVGSGARLRVAPAVLQATADPDTLAQAAQTMADWSFGGSASEALKRDFIEGLLATRPGVVHGDFVACNAFDVMARLGELRVPALIVCGSEDRLTPPKYAEHLRDHLQGARLSMVAGAGHLVMLETPGAVAEAMAAFLASLV